MMMNGLVMQSEPMSVVFNWIPPHHKTCSHRRDKPKPLKPQPKHPQKVHIWRGITYVERDINERTNSLSDVRWYYECHMLCSLANCS